MTAVSWSSDGTTLFHKVQYKNMIDREKSCQNSKTPVESRSVDLRMAPDVNESFLWASCRPFRFPLCRSTFKLLAKSRGKKRFLPLVDTTTRLGPFATVGYA